MNSDKKTTDFCQYYQRVGLQNTNLQVNFAYIYVSLTLHKQDLSHSKQFEKKKHYFGYHNVIFMSFA